jgi:hypothetical protein
VAKSRPAISVIMAVRNGAAYLDDALASLAAQDFADFEVVLVDNGSLDGTAGIVADWMRREPRIHCVLLERPGLARSLNHAAARARAPYLARLDADDICLPSRLGKQYSVMQARPRLGLLGSFVELIDADGRKLRDRDLPVGDATLQEFLRSGNPFVHSSVMIRRDVFERVGGYREGLRLCEDFDLWCRMAEITEIDNLAVPLVRYRQHPSSLSFRQSTRVALADTCIVAAREARQRGEPEPFVRGCPALRRALALLGVSRQAFQYRALKITTNAARLAIELGDRDLARQGRRRTWRLLLGLPVGRVMLHGAGHILSSYFRPYSRVRRKALRARLRERWPFNVIWKQH